MAWTERIGGATWKTYLDNGTTAGGAVKTVAVNMGAVNSEAWDSTKAAQAGAILTALVPILEKSLVKSIHGVDNYLEQG